tara:strand:+ start:1239 stop:1460 length:222 start_codon:yes stop_codon:yes gene_type:complete
LVLAGKLSNIQLTLGQKASRRPCKLRDRLLHSEESRQGRINHTKQVPPELMLTLPLKQCKYKENLKERGLVLG